MHALTGASQAPGRGWVDGWTIHLGLLCLSTASQLANFLNSASTNASRLSSSPLFAHTSILLLAPQCRLFCRICVCVASVFDRNLTPRCLFTSLIDCRFVLSLVRCPSNAGSATLSVPNTDIMAMTTTTGGEAAAAETSQAPMTKITILDLPAETQREIASHVSRCPTCLRLAIPYLSYRLSL